MSTNMPAPDMGEGKNPEKEIIGWQNVEAWKPVEKSDAPADGSTPTKSKPKCSITGEDLVAVGKTTRKGNTIYLSEADNIPADRNIEGGALYLWRKKNEG